MLLKKYSDFGGGKKIWFLMGFVLIFLRYLCSVLQFITCPVSVGHCIVCSSSIYASDYPLWVIYRVMVFNATFNNISVISWRSVLLMEETIDLPQVTDKLYHTMLYRGLPTLLAISTDSIGSCKSNYHTFMATSTPYLFGTFKRFLFAGIKGKTLMTIASLHQDTCLDMPDFEQVLQHITHAITHAQICLILSKYFNILHVPRYA